MLNAVCHKQGCQDVYIIFITIHSDAPAARFNAASQRFKRFKSCYAAFKVQSETEGPYTPKALHAPQALYTLRSSFTRSSAALHAEGFTRAVGALPAPQVLYTRFSALNA
jgi:hypothetical protein